MSPRSSFHPSTFQPFLLSTLPLHFTAQLLHRTTPNTLPNSTITPLSHLVGYQNRAAAKDGWNLVCGTFLTVGKAGSAMTLADVKANDDWDLTNDTIQFLNAGGGTRVREDGYTAEYTYVTAEYADMLGCEVGWYQFDALNAGEDFLTPEAGDDFSFGAGAVVQVGTPTAGLLCAGEVAKGAQTVIAEKSGWNIMGNPLPINMTLADVTANDDWDLTNDTIQFLNAGGGTKVREDGYTAEYTFVNAEYADMLGCEVGWYQFDALNAGEDFLTPDEEDNAVTAGTAFVAQTGSTNAGIQFKAAIAE